MRSADDDMGQQRGCSVAGCMKPHAARGWCSTHWSRWKRTGDATTPPRHTYDPWERIRAKTATDTAPECAPRLGSCVLWTGYLNGDGYATFSVGGKMWLVHRWAYEQQHGEVPPGFELDHLCRRRNCVRVDHVQPVTHTLNVQRGVRPPRRSHCLKGHPYTPETTYVSPAGVRACRICVNARKRLRYAEDPEPVRVAVRVRRARRHAETAV